MWRRHNCLRKMVFRFTCVVLWKLHGLHRIFDIAVSLCDWIYSGVRVSLVQGSQTGVDIPHRGGATTNWFFGGANRYKLVAVPNKYTRFENFGGEIARLPFWLRACLGVHLPGTFKVSDRRKKICLCNVHFKCLYLYIWICLNRFVLLMRVDKGEYWVHACLLHI